MIASLVAQLTQFMVWQKDQYSSIYGFPKFVVFVDWPSFGCHYGKNHIYEIFECNAIGKP
jgi:hypothetical protein